MLELASPRGFDRHRLLCQAPFWIAAFPIKSETTETRKLTYWQKV